MKGESKLKLEFFIGGTRRDLGDATQKLIDTIVKAKHIASGMELWAGGVIAGNSVFAKLLPND